ncbi:MAG: hydrogenase expression/formation protein HypE [Elusimicrobia bacterium]|nr:hydrogenase expression/formation protein HypE [Elusimicrobiota bacterium]
MDNKKITLSDGSGGKSTHNLIKNFILKKLGNPILNRMDDSAVLNPNSLISNPLISKLVFTTDSYVIKPIFFPGGDIGKLCICGTVNDLSVMGAKPLYISLSAIIEDGLEIEKLEKIVSSIAETSKKAGVQIVCGDTKVVEKGAADEIFITTSGIGVIDKKLSISGHNAVTGDIIIISGTIADHGIAVLNARQELGFKGKLESDVAPLNNLIEKMLKAGEIHVMRDPTRGGLATTLNEITEQSNTGIEIYENKIPIKKPVKSACDILGLDPLYVANEGKVIAIVQEKDAQKILSAMKKHPLGKNAEIIGKVISKPKDVLLKTKIGGSRILQMLESDQLPRIC